MTIEELQHQYYTLCHAMQSGVAYKMNYDESETNPKHLRVGINSAMVEHGALVGLLIAKGIITEQEWWEALVKQMEQEVASYKKWLSTKLGADVDLA